MITMQLTHSKNLIPHWLLYLESLARSPGSMEHVTDSKRRQGPDSLMLEAIRHRSTLCCANSIAKGLTSAAPHHSSETIATMKNYCAGKSKAGGLPDNKFYESLRKSLQKPRETFFTPGQHHILELFEVTGEILEQVYRISRKKKRRVVPWLRGSVGVWSIIQYTKRLQVQFLVRIHT